ncbi:hypothetical protein Trydic_g22455 [Trypoxylus dichotomus]
MADKSQEGRRNNLVSKSRSKSRREFVSRNPFVNFLRHFRQLPENQNRSQALIFKMAGERWRNMSDNERAPFINAAKEVQEKEPRVKKPKKKGNTSTKVTTERNKKKIKKRKCSKCGHSHGGSTSRDGSTDSFEKEGYDGDDDKSTVASPSTSRSKSLTKSDSGSNDVESNYASDTDATF